MVEFIIIGVLAAFVGARIGYFLGYIKRCEETAWIDEPMPIDYDPEYEIKFHFDNK